MSRKFRLKYIELTQDDHDYIVSQIKAGRTKNAVLLENRYTKNAIDTVIKNAGIKYEDRRPENLKRSKEKPKPVKIEDIPRLCVEEMPPVHKRLNQIWKPTGLSV